MRLFSVATRNKYYERMKQLNFQIHFVIREITFLIIFDDYYKVATFCDHRHWSAYRLGIVISSCLLILKY